ncbi:MAG: PAS domain-containing protein, partial [Pseudomonadota bacterium]
MAEKNKTTLLNGALEKTGAAEPIAALCDVPRPRVEAPWIILVALLLATILAAYQSNERSKKDAQARFEDMANHAGKEVFDEIRHIEDAIALAGAVISSSPRIDNVRWNNYLDARKNKAAPVVGLVRLEYRAAHLNKARRKMRPNEAPNQQTLPPSLIRDTAEEAALVKELTSSVLIDDAIVTARTSQKSVMTSALVDKKTLKPSKYSALVSPVYASASRSNKPLGYMVAILHPASLLQLITKENNPRLILSVSENNVLLFNYTASTTLQSTLVAKLPMKLGQRDWQLNVEATSALVDELSSQMPGTILFVGVLGTLSLVGLVWLLTRLREQAATLANSMTLKLRDQVKFTDDLIELNPNPIYRKDSNGRYVAVNRAWEQLSKRSRIDVIGKTGREFQDQREANMSEKFDLDVLNSTSGFEAREEMVINAAGEPVPTILAKQVIKRADGTIDGIICTITDVTLVKKLEQEVARQREQLDLVIRSSQQGIFDVDFTSEGKVYYSERFREILGLGMGSIPEKFGWKDWVLPADEEIFRDRLLEHLKRKRPY